MDTEMQELVTSIAKERHLSGKWPFDRLLAIIDALTDYDQDVERHMAKAKNFIKAGVALLLIPIPGFFAASYFNLPWGHLVCGLLLVLGIPFLALGIIQLVRNESKNLRDDYRDYLRPLLTRLADDIKPGSPIAVDLYLSPIKQKAFSKGEGPKYAKGAYHTCQDHHYERTLFSLKLRLRDTNRLLLTVHEHFVRTTRTKKAASGKSKTKFKHRKRLTYDIKTLVNPENFSCEPLPESQHWRFYSKQRGNIPIIGVRVKDELKWGWEDKDLSLDLFTTFKPLMTLYARIHPKHSESAQSTAPA